ncbi:regenerating islet-derived protein 3-alpha-like [Tamandua tetradactyla]|uniref:regenerating islet-derived protein 3-alpha-like n=1 Tax=Tamandua tetradactyla TaxID=48850 RepID=UPI004054974B
MLPPMAHFGVFWMLLSCLMLLSQVQGNFPETRSRCPRGSRAYGLYCYALFVKPKSWMDADMACQKQSSGHLVSVLSGVEGSFVAALIKSQLRSYSYVWIGLNDPTQGMDPSADGWEWSSNDMMHYSSWEKHPSSVSSPGHCAIVSRTTGFLKWRDYNCDIALPYVCKFKG